MPSSPDILKRPRIVITGARQNNLKNIDVEIPLGLLTVITGLSGSGKSSLAMDTLYAEGQRRYLEGVSAYARRFLERTARPDVDGVDRISPAVALDQRTGSRNARSTVGTSTEIYDYLRLLFARVGTLVCERCGEPVRRWTIASVADAIGSQGPDARILVGFPHPVTSDSEGGLRRRGYLRVIVNGVVEEIQNISRPRGEWLVLQDRVRAGNRGRLVEALEAAFREGEGRAVTHTGDGGPVHHRLGRVCNSCDRAFAEPTPQLFSFNSPVGACPSCRGFGSTLEFDLAKIIRDENLSLEEGVIHPWAGRWRGHFTKKLEASPRAREIPRRVPWRTLKPEDREFLLHGGRGFPGVLAFLTRLEKKSYKAGARFLVKRYQSPEPCRQCGGTRLRAEALRITLGGSTLPEWCSLPIHRFQEFLEGISLTPAERETVGTLLEDLERRISILLRVGLGYLTLDRQSRTLSGGESQRIELSQALGAGLVNALYVLDEPTIGLHPRDTGRLLDVLRDLGGRGNTVVVVEHDIDMIRASDWMVDLGPGAGREGGDVVFCGPSGDRLEGPPSPTTDILQGKGGESRPPIEDPRGWLRIRDGRIHNLKKLDVDIPWGLMVGVCGVSGSGKSSLVTDTLVPLLESRDRGETIRSDDERGKLIVEAPLTGFRVVDQSPLSRSSRSIPASYVGAWTGVRALFASHPEALRLGFGPGAFSFNVSGGRCDSCRGEGETTVDMDFMADVRLSCETCQGRRFSSAIQAVRYRGHSISDVLDLTVDEAIEVFRGAAKVTGPLRWMQRVGLGYLVLGQSAATLSGGEAQRLKLVRELSAKSSGNLIMLDEPTVGLHGVEVIRLVELLRWLVRAGNTILIVEHHTDVLASCDWLIELGPEGGEGGGMLIASGPPEVVARSRESLLAPYLRPVLTGGRKRPPRTEVVFPG